MNKETILKRHMNFDWEKFMELKENRNKILSLLSIKRHEKNQLVQKRVLGETVKKINEEIENLENILKPIEKDYDFLKSRLPNLLDPRVPHGLSSKDNVLIKQKGNIIFNKHHYEIGLIKNFPWLSSRFIVLTKQFAKLERVLSSFMLDFLISKGFQEYSMPCILPRAAFERSQHIPKSEENMYALEDKFLIPTGEVPLVNLAYKKQFMELPNFVCTSTPCFRREAGSAGIDTKGLIRLHQFQKVEMVVFSEETQSMKMLEQMLSYACEILELLEIPYRIMLLCSGDTPLNSAITYDLEIPIGGEWREVSSISNCLDLQSKKLGAKDSQGKFIHILNGSGLAIGRTLASLVEVHYDTTHNKIIIPEALVLYTGFREIHLD